MGTDVTDSIIFWVDSFRNLIHSTNTVCSLLDYSRKHTKITPLVELMFH